jgi:hypothetical protein
MPDFVSADIIIWPFPPSLEHESGQELLKHLAAADIDTLALLDILKGEGDCVVVHENGNRSLMSGEGEYNLRFDDQKGIILHICEYQASGGTAHFTNTSLPRALQERDLAFVISDDGGMGLDGDEHSWSPGMKQIRVRQRLGSGDTALSDAAFDSLKNSAATKHGIDVVKLGELVLNHFDYDPHDWWPGKPEAEEVELPVVEIKPGQRSRVSGLAG